MVAGAADEMARVVEVGRRFEQSAVFRAQLVQRPESFEQLSSELGDALRMGGDHTAAVRQLTDG